MSGNDGSGPPNDAPDGVPDTDGGPEADEEEPDESASDRDSDDGTPAGRSPTAGEERSRPGASPSRRADAKTPRDGSDDEPTDDGSPRDDDSAAAEPTSGSPTSDAAHGESTVPAGEDATSGETTDTTASETTEDDARSDAGPDAFVAEDISAADLTIPPQSLDPRVRYVWIAQSLFTAAVFALLVGGGAVVAVGEAYWVGPAVFAAFAILGIAHSILRYRIWEYEVREDALYLERGVVTRVRTVVPYVRIQHVDASRGPVERAVGLASSVVYTAGSRGADVTIPGLTPDGADDLQQRLKRLAIIAEGDDAV